MNDRTYPTVQIKTPMPPEAPTLLSHKGMAQEMPGKFDHASATYLLSLMNYSAACAICEGEHFEPLPMILSKGERKAVGYVATVDYHQTDVGPYREWILGLWVVPRDTSSPRLTFTNPASLAFYGPLAGDHGFACYSPKMILTEPLPTEVGLDHYGIPKEMGKVTYERSPGQTSLAAETADGQWLMRATMPTARGFWGRCQIRFYLLRAFGLAPTFRFARRAEVPLRLYGSAKLNAKYAFAVSKVDPKTELLPWQDQDCSLEINPDSHWGTILLDLGFAPQLICHVPNLAFVFSGPIEQMAQP